MGGEGGGRDGWRGVGEWTEWVGEENRQRKRQVVRGREEGGDTLTKRFLRGSGSGGREGCGGRVRCGEREGCGRRVR